MCGQGQGPRGIAHKRQRADFIAAGRGGQWDSKSTTKIIAAGQWKGGTQCSTTTLSPPGEGTGGLYIHNGIVAAGNEKGGPNIHNGTIAAGDERGGLNSHNGNYCCWALARENSMSTMKSSPPGDGRRGL